MFLFRRRPLAVLRFLILLVLMGAWLPVVNGHGVSAAGLPAGFSGRDGLRTTSISPAGDDQANDDDDDDDDDDDKPDIKYFKADRTTIAAGESVVLTWDLEGAKKAYLEVDGKKEGITAPGSKTVNPTVTTTYKLIAENNDGTVYKKITITVSGVKATDTPTAVVEPTVIPTDTPAPTFTAPPPPTNTPPPPPPTETAVPPTDTPVPTAAPTDTAEPPTPEPQVVPATPAPDVPTTPTWTPVPFPKGTAEAPTVGGAWSGLGGHGPLLREDGAVGTRGPSVTVAILGGLIVFGGLAGLVLVLVAVRRG